MKAEIPELKTQEQGIKEMVDDGEHIAGIMLTGMCGYLSRMPTYNDEDEIARNAIRDMRNMDFGDMGDYIDSLVQLVGHWKERAEHYLDCVDETKYKMDELGYLDEREVE